MSDALETVLKAALSLTGQERAALAERLLETLDENHAKLDQAAIDAAWGAEADRRYEAYKRGEMKTVPMEDVREMLNQWMGASQNAEIDRRLDEINSGNVTLIPGDEAMQLFRERKKS